MAWRALIQTPKGTADHILRMLGPLLLLFLSPILIMAFVSRVVCLRRSECSPRACPCTDTCSRCRNGRFTRRHPHHRGPPPALVCPAECISRWKKSSMNMLTLSSRSSITKQTSCRRLYHLYRIRCGHQANKANRACTTFRRGSWMLYTSGVHLNRDQRASICSALPRLDNSQT